MSVANAFKGVIRAYHVPEPVFDLVQSINGRLSTDTIYPPPNPEQTYRVSHVVKLCPREEVLRHIHQVQKVEKVDAKLKRIFDIGRAFHTLVQNEWLGQWGLLVGDWECLNCHCRYSDVAHPKLCQKCYQPRFFYHEPEPFNREFGVTAHLDGIILANGKKIVLELKTANSMQFNLVANVKRQAQEPHRKQIQMYMFLTGIKEGVILYFNKDDSTIHQFDEKYDPSIVDAMLLQLKVAREGMRRKIVPQEKVCDTKSCARAKSCAVREICFSK